MSLKVPFAKILQRVVSEFTAQSHDSQHKNPPVTETLLTNIVAGCLIDVAGCQLDDLIPQFDLGVKMLKAGQNWYYLITTFKIERDLFDRQAVQSKMIRVSSSNDSFLEDLR